MKIFRIMQILMLLLMAMLMAAASVSAAEKQATDKLAADKLLLDSVITRVDSGELTDVQGLQLAIDQEVSFELILNAVMTADLSCDVVPSKLFETEATALQLFMAREFCAVEQGLGYTSLTGKVEPVPTPDPRPKPVSPSRL